MEKIKAKGSHPLFQTLFTVGALVFAAGGFFANSRELEAAETKMQVKLDDHVAAPGHAVDEERIKQLEQERAVLEAEVKEIHADVQKMSGNIISLCQANRGAQCVR